MSNFSKNNFSKTISPSGCPPVTEEELLEATEKACHRLVFKFRFGYHEVDDLKQEAYIYAYRVISEGKWDGRPLDAFLYVHIHNRLYNFKRKHYERLEKPCSTCPLAAYRKEDDKCLAYESKDLCSFYQRWLERNRVKRNLMHPTSDEVLHGQAQGDGELPPMEVADELDSLERLLPAELIPFFQKMRRGEGVPLEVEERVLFILKGGEPPLPPQGFNFPADE